MLRLLAVDELYHERSPVSSGRRWQGRSCSAGAWRACGCDRGRVELAMAFASRSLCKSCRINSLPAAQCTFCAHPSWRHGVQPFAQARESWRRKQSLRTEVQVLPCLSERGSSPVESGDLRLAGVSGQQSGRGCLNDEFRRAEGTHDRTRSDPAKCQRSSTCKQFFSHERQFSALAAS